MGKECISHVYLGTGQWFFEDNRPHAYNPDAARLAWEWTMEFLNKHLKQAE